MDRKPKPISRAVMDSLIKPMILNGGIQLGFFFEEDVIPDNPKSRIIADVFDTIIKAREDVNDKRMALFYKSIRNTILYIYQNDSHYSDDVEKAMLALARHIPEISEYRR